MESSSAKQVDDPSAIEGASRSSQLPKWVEISSFSDEELFTLFNASERQFPMAFAIKNTTVRQIASDAVMKVTRLDWDAPPGPDSEPMTMSLVRQQTSILVPAVKRQFTYKDKIHVFIMDFIPGQTLMQCWHSLSFFRRTYIVFTLRRYVRELRHVEVPGTTHSQQFPGRLGPECRPCFGPMFSIYGGGPFASYDQLTPWFMHKLDVNRRIRKVPENDMTFDSSLPLVLTHLDLHPQNIILDHGNRVWLIDWEHAGFYPQWFEFYSMDIGWEILGRWKTQLLGFIAGFYHRRADFINSIGWAIDTGAFIV